MLISLGFSYEKVYDAFHRLYPVTNAVARRVEHVWVAYILCGPVEQM